jgi:hypothetical protein
MAVKSAIKFYIFGIGISSLHGIYKDKAYIYDNKLNDRLIYSFGSTQGFGIGLLNGIVWPITITSKLIDFTENIYVITKNN